MSASAPAPSGKNMTTVLVPVAGVALIVVLVVVIAATTDNPQPTKTEKDIEVPSLTSGPGRPMSDGSNGGTDDPGLKPIGSAGLKYRELKEGVGAECPKGASVQVHYTGWTVNGNVFDSSRKHGTEPAEFSLNGVVAGWREGIPGMKVGGIRKLVIPPELGYGSRGMGRDIPPNATLIFEVELVAIK
jgi:hypothetical protein